MTVNLLRSAITRNLTAAAALVLAAGVFGGISQARGAPASSTTGVVVIQTRLGLANGTAAATGMVLTSSGEVMTNNHVIRGATEIRVRIPATGRIYGARVLGYSVSADVALLKLTGASDLDTVSIGNSSTVRVGDDVTAVGNAGGTGTLATKEGEITDVGRTITVGDSPGTSARLTHLLETDAGLRPGDSGGPLLDGAGRVIGMSAAASIELGNRSTGSDGYAIPVNRATAIARQIERGDSSVSVHIGATPFLGVSIARARSFGAAGGVVVAGVESGSPAARAGLGAGDVIVSFNGNPVRTYSKLVSRLLRWHPGDTARIAWMDELGSRETATVTLTSGPPQ
jgi:S1-C subfamily serine protease